MLKIPSLPACFGKSWEPDALECIGGVDPAWTAEKGEPVRPTCEHIQACSTRVLAAKNPQVIPPSSLYRPTETRTSLPAPGYRPPPPPVHQPWQPPTYQHHQPQQPQNYGYQKMVPVNYEMPAYLSVREPLDQPRGKRLFFEILRSLIKSFGHTLSNFSDTEAFTQRRPPGG